MVINNLTALPLDLQVATTFLNASTSVVNIGLFFLLFCLFTTPVYNYIVFNYGLRQFWNNIILAVYCTIYFLLIILFCLKLVASYNFNVYSLVDPYILKFGTLTPSTVSITYLNCSQFAILPDCIVLLCLIISYVCVAVLGDNNIKIMFTYIPYFTSFSISTILMVYANNFLLMFLGFEGLFIPTVFFIYRLAYAKKADYAVQILVFWTLTGAFLVFCPVAYLYMIYGTLEFSFYIKHPLTTLELNLIMLCFLVGFGVKIPVFPFHHWLTRVHVEAPTGFSMFLSGYLVKAALYCVWQLLIIFPDVYIYRVFLLFALIGSIETSVKMWTQVDLKKLIAYATIQEMGLLLILILLQSTVLSFTVIIFLLMHGVLSCLLFYLVDIIYKRTKTRNIHSIRGLSAKVTGLGVYLWGALLFFCGFPFTIKFIVEFKLIVALVEWTTIGVIVIIVLILTSSVGFSKNFLIILYGTPNTTDIPVIGPTSFERSVLHFLAYLLFMLLFMYYFLV